MKKYLILVLVLCFGVTFAQKKRKVITSYGYETTQQSYAAVLETETVQAEKFYTNSTSNALLKGGKNRIIIPVNLPIGTQEWFYRFTASRSEEDIKNTLNTFNLAAELTEYINSKNPLKNAVTNLTTPPGANICDIYLLDEKNAKNFKNKDDYDYSLSASRENTKSGVVAVKTVTKAPLFLGIKNSDNLHGIHIALEIVAVVKRHKTITETIRIPIYTSVEE